MLTPYCVRLGRGCSIISTRFWGIRLELMVQAAHCNVQTVSVTDAEAGSGLRSHAWYREHCDETISAACGGCV